MATGNQSAPRWARLLLEAVCAEHSVPAPSLDWRLQSDLQPLRCNVTYQRVGQYERKKDNIIVYAGQDHLENRMNLLHEIAHHVGYIREGLVGHPPGFWFYCWTIYRRHRIPLAEAIISEFGYLAGAERALHTMGVRLNRAQQIAAELGNTSRRDLWLQIQIQRLRARLPQIRSDSKRLPLKRSLRRLSDAQRAQASLLNRYAVAYKRVARRPSGK